MRIVVTGSDGFIGRNLRVRLGEAGYSDMVGLTRSASPQAWNDALHVADFVFHLAGINRPHHPAEFESGNAGLTQTLCDALAASGRVVPVVLASSTQAALDNAYGRSKRDSESAIRRYGVATGSPVHVLRLTNVFGKWSRPNYNSAVATFCHNIARGLPVVVNDPFAPLNLIYVDDVIETFLSLLTAPPAASGSMEASPVYASTVGAVVEALRSFADSRQSLITARVGTGFLRALYATYVSHLPSEAFDYALTRHIDPRGEFVEMLKTPDCGQFSYFTAGPGVTRGEHYHHSKTEKFLVIRGTARFGFRHIESGERHNLVTRGGEARVVETVPGWTHNITNVGSDELIVMLWANEIFDLARPDTVSMKVAP